MQIYAQYTNAKHNKENENKEKTKQEKISKVKQAVSQTYCRKSIYIYTK